MCTIKNEINQLYEFLKIPSHNNITGLFSCFSIGLKQAREATGRDYKTGKLIEFDKQINMSAILGYFALLEQIGKCFIPKSNSSKTKKTNHIHKALYHFSSSLNSKEILVVRALRNTFSHDFGLYATDKGNKSDKRFLHHFKLIASDFDPLFQLRKEDWDGNINTISIKNITTVNIEKLCSLIDKICIEVQELAKKDELEILLSGGLNEYKNRYSINCKYYFKIQLNSKIDIFPTIIK